MTDNEIKVVGITDKRPCKSDTFETCTDEEILGKTFYFKKNLVVSVFPRKSPTPAIRFNVSSVKIEPCDFDINDNPINSEYILFDAESKNFDCIQPEIKIMFEKDGDNIRFKTNDTLFVNLNLNGYCTKEYEDNAEKVEYKKVQEVE